MQKKLIVGLGNPGKAYKRTRHNVGFLVVEQLAGRAVWQTHQHPSVLLSTPTDELVLAKPQSFMNRSGEIVQGLLQALDLPVLELLVVHDDADLLFTDLRLEFGRSSAGHRGVESIIEHLGTHAFTRLRIGIGRPENPQETLEDWVLGRWGKEEKRGLPSVLTKSQETIHAWLSS
jgi:PTH1 family peptidyl-tRNA hydrolase